MQQNLQVPLIDPNSNQGNIQPMVQPGVIQQTVYVQGQSTMVYQPQVYGQPQQVVYILPAGYAPTDRAKWGFDKLNPLDGVYIKQKFFAEEALGCEVQNQYMIHGLNKTGDKKGKTLFKCKEKSSLASRYCLSANCRPFNMKVYHHDDDKMADHEPFLFFQRDCKLTCLCFNRPEIKVSYVDNGESKYLGKVTQPWKLCDLNVQIYDENEKERYRVNGDCCQLGLWCKFPCEACQTIDFNVYNSMNEKVSTLQKQTAGCLVSAISNTSNFAVNFPESSTQADKALFIAATILLDFSYFEEKPDKNESSIQIEL